MNKEILNKEILLFGGTTEGRLLAEYLTANHVPFDLCVATEFGKELAAPFAGNILEGRLSRDEMLKLCGNFRLVIDATHPYAEVVTDNIKYACESTVAQYLRLLRPGLNRENLTDVKFFENNSLVVKYLNSVDGNILVTTGSKEAADFCHVEGFEKRVFLRMLPMADGILKCVELGYSNANLICIQGRFSVEMNLEFLKSTKAKYLVTKDSGEAGGFYEKLTAARLMGVEVLVVSRPSLETGHSLEETKALLAERYRIAKEISSPAPAPTTTTVPTPKNAGRFPLFVDISGKNVVVVGGGNVATRRVETLLKFSPVITVIAPEISERLREFLQDKKLIHLQRKYLSGDLAGAEIVLAATNCRQTNALVSHEAAALGIHCSVSDSIEDGSFWFPGVVTTQNGLVVGVIADGKNHGLAKAAVEKIREVLGDENR